MQIIETYEVRELTRCTKDDKEMGLYKGALLFRSKIMRDYEGAKPITIWHDATGHMWLSEHGYEIEGYAKRTVPSNSALVKIVEDSQLEPAP